MDFSNTPEFGSPEKHDTGVDDFDKNQIDREEKDNEWKAQARKGYHKGEEEAKDDNEYVSFMDELLNKKAKKKSRNEDGFRRLFFS